ncbi:MAG: hypothetical protein ACRYGK_07500, partial [Janthinobacterium lividum]
AVCAAEYMPLVERLWLPIKGVPRSLWRNVTFWKDVASAKRIGDACKKTMEHGKVVDETLLALIAEADSLMAQHALAHGDDLTSLASSQPAVVVAIETMLHHLGSIESALDEASGQRYRLGQQQIAQPALSETDIVQELLQVANDLELIDEYGLMDLDADLRAGMSEDLSKVARLTQDLRGHGASMSMLRQQMPLRQRLLQPPSEPASHVLLATARVVEDITARVTRLKNALENEVTLDSMPQ